MRQQLLWGAVLLVGALAMWAPSSRSATVKPPLLPEQAWIDSVYQSLSPEQRLGQLFMVAAFSNKDAAHVRRIDELITRYNIGGLIFMQGGPYRQAVLTNRFQKEARTPLLVSMDVEWGLDMRLDSSLHFAKQMTLGAVDDDRYVYQMGREIALRLKQLGVHISFSPVVDVNVNPLNPVIGNRAFGENKEDVARRAVAYVKGLQDYGVVAVAKHFPGHGDTDTDSHLALPVVTHSLEQLRDEDLYPFRKTIEAGVMGVMVAHLYVPALDTTRNRASTLSAPVVTGLLRNELEFDGLIFTDALNMKGVAKYYKPGEVDALALRAGNDVLLYSGDVPSAINRNKEDLKSGVLDSSTVAQSIRKILRTKYWAGLNRRAAVDPANFRPDRLANAAMERPDAYVVQQQLYEHATTVVRNERNLLPFRHLDTLRVASVTIGLGAGNDFQRTMAHYVPLATFPVADRYAPDSVFQKLLPELRPFNVIVVSYHGMNNTPAAHNFGLGDAGLAFIKQLRLDNPRARVVAVPLGNPYALKSFDDALTLVCGYEDNNVSQRVVPQVLFGAVPAVGKLPITASPKAKRGAGVALASLGRLRFAPPETVGMDSRTLGQLDNLAHEAIAYAATPGCQVLVVKDGVVVWEKGYGRLTYDAASAAVTPATVYDIASITKVAATLQAVMFLKDQGRLALDEKLGAYLPELKGTNKADLRVRDLLLHQAGLQAFIPYWQQTFTPKHQPAAGWYAQATSVEFPNQVADSLYSRASAEDSLWRWTLTSPVAARAANQKPEYKYSDLDFILLRRLAEKLLGQHLDEFVKQNFYDPLGLPTLTYNPLQHGIARARIAPTEHDTTFRNRQVWGTVHDPGAALVGGIAGHAGLFGTATDLATLFQMNLQAGYYGGQRYFRTPVVQEFARGSSDVSRRGLGWDRADPTHGGGAASGQAPASTFGHTGFTGTCAWADPKNKLVFIFLSNRVFPDANNSRLVQYNIRTRMHDVVYRALKPAT
ncbi:MAG: serine hydrolase [Hymenobacteraceae bacterium]|nr:serine hydrolase [Hymenobacteraceae bacterium]